MVTVSVLMAVGPDAPYVGEAMASLESQTFQDFEVLQQREKGIQNAWNAGSLRARGEYLAILDSDDIAFPQRLEKQVTVMDSDPELVVLGSWAENFGAMHGTLKRPKVVNRMNLLIRNQLLNPTTMIRRSFALPWRDEPWIDYSLWCRMAKAGRKMRNIQEPLVKRRVHSANDTWARSWEKIIYGEIAARLQLI